MISPGWSLLTDEKEKTSAKFQPCIIKSKLIQTIKKISVLDGMSHSQVSEIVNSDFYKIPHEIFLHLITQHFVVPDNYDVLRMNDPSYGAIQNTLRPSTTIFDHVKRVREAMKKNEDLNAKRAKTDC